MSTSKKYPCMLHHYLPIGCMSLNVRLALSLQSQRLDRLVPKGMRIMPEEERLNMLGATITFIKPTLKCAQTYNLKVLARSSLIAHLSVAQIAVKACKQSVHAASCNLYAYNLCQRLQLTSHVPRRDAEERRKRC